MSGEMPVLADLDRIMQSELTAYLACRPGSAKLAAERGRGFVKGVPLHWMTDWPQPFPMVIDTAMGNQLRDIDGNQVTDFCLGDTAAMFGHAPAPLMRALSARAEGGLSYMLPSRDVQPVGALLVERFGLPCWQIACTASDANRFAIRAARAATGRDTIVVFDGCYHGTVEDTLVDLIDGTTLPRRSLLGEPRNRSISTVAIPFNDEEALESALAGRDVACVIAEPVMTNSGMILPQPGFLERMRQMTRATGTLLIIDETHTISSGPGGYAKAIGLPPDLFVVGKPVAGGVPTAVWGMTQEVSDALFAARPADEHGHSGIGTTLSGNALQLACLRAVLEEIMVPATYAKMISAAEALEAGIETLIGRFGLPWHVARVGARLEIVFSRLPLRNAAESRNAANDRVQALMHIALLNRGYLLTPFHNMMLVSPDTTEPQVHGFLAAFRQVLELLTGRE